MNYVKLGNTGMDVSRICLSGLYELWLGGGLVAQLVGRSTKKIAAPSSRERSIWVSISLILPIFMLVASAKKFSVGR